MSFEVRKLRSNSFKPVSAGRTNTISTRSNGGAFQQPGSKHSIVDKEDDIQKLSSKLFKNLEDAFDPTSHVKANDYDFLTGTTDYSDRPSSAKKSGIDSYPSLEDNNEAGGRYKAVAAFAKNRVKRFKEENPGAYMRFKYDRNNADAGPFALTTLNYEGEMHQKEVENYSPEEEEPEEIEDPDEFLKKEAAEYRSKIMNPGDDLEELRKMIRSTQGMIKSYQKQTMTLQKSVRDLNDQAGTIGLGVKGDVFHRVDSTMQELRESKVSSMRAKPATFIKSTMSNKAPTVGMKPKSTTSVNFSKPSTGGMPRIAMKK